MTALQDSEIQNFLAAGIPTERSVRVGCRVDRPGSYRLCLCPRGTDDAVSVDVEVRDEVADLTAGWTWPDDLPGASELEPSTSYEASLWRGDERIARAEFTTAPAPTRAPASWCFAAMSCHQPYEENGELHAGSETMLEAARRLLRPFRPFAATNCRDAR